MDATWTEVQNSKKLSDYTVDSVAIHWKPEDSSLKIRSVLKVTL